MNSMKRSTTILIAGLLSITAGCSQPSQQEYKGSPINSQNNPYRTAASEVEVQRLLNELNNNIRAPYLALDEEQASRLETKSNNVSKSWDEKRSILSEQQYDKLAEQLKEVNALVAASDGENALEKLSETESLLDGIPMKLPIDQRQQTPRQGNNAKPEVDESRKSIDTINVGPVNVPFPFLLVQISSLVGLISFVMAIATLLQAREHGNEITKQKSQTDQLKDKNKEIINSINTIILELGSSIRPDLKKNQSRIEQLERGRQQANLTKTEYSASKQITQIEETKSPIMPQLEIARPKGPSKEMLIDALNSGDRQKVREAAISQLNITNESENAIATGRSVTTELEVVSAGGSYQLIEIDGQSWLFPTVQTLGGFASTQTSKGIFDFEQQVISNPILAEPALIEKSGSKWKVKQLGKIVVPKI